MTRKLLIIFSIVLGVITLGMLVFYFILKSSSSRVSPALDAVPPTAGLVITVKDPFVQTPGILSQPWWQGLDSLGMFHRFSSRFAWLDSLVRTNERTASLMKGADLVVSLHPTANGVRMLFSLGLRSRTPDQFIDQFIQKAHKEARLEKIKTDAGTVRSIKLMDEAGQFYYAVRNGVFVCSLDFSLVEAALVQLRERKPWMSGAGFQLLQRSIGADKKVQLYFRPDLLAGLLSGYGNAATGNFWKELSGFCGWAGGSIAWKEQGLFLSGLVTLDSAGYMLTRLGENEKPEDEIGEYLPSSTIFFADYAWSESSAAAYIPAEYTSEGSWTEDLRSRICFFTTITGQGELCRMALMDYNDAEGKWQEWITSLTEPADTFRSNGYSVFRLRSVADLLQLPFSAFTADDSLYICLLNEYVVLSSGREGIRDYLGKFVSNQVLANQAYYQDWKEMAGANGHLTFFLRPDMSKPLSNAYLDEKSLGNWEQYRTAWKLVPACGAVLTRKGNYYAMQVPLLVSSSFTQQMEVSWEAGLQTPAIIPPAWICAKGDTSGFILVQDSSHTLYSMDMDGVIRWKRQLDGKITSAITSVEFYEPGGQAVFSTTAFVYAIDGEGKNLPGFPLEIPGGSASGLGLIKYAEDEGYRLLVVNDAGKALLWDKNGQPVEGWQRQDRPSSVASPVHHIRTGNKDYLVFLLKDGTILLTDRQGNTALELPQAMKGINSAPVLVVNNTLSASAVVFSTAEGNCRIVYLDAGKDPDTHTSLPGTWLADYADADRDGVKDFIVTDGKKISRIDRTGKTLAAFELEATTHIRPVAVTVNGEYRLLVCGDVDEKVYLLDADLHLQEGFPVSGSGQAALFGDDQTTGIWLVSNYFNKLLGYRLNFSD